jgi:hypothetical protein
MLHAVDPALKLEMDRMLEMDILQIHCRSDIAGRTEDPWCIRSGLIAVVWQRLMRQAAVGVIPGIQSLKGS